MARRPTLSVRGALGAATAALLHLSCCAPVPEHPALLVAAVQVKRSFDRLLGPRQPLDATSHRKLAADKKNEFVVTDLKSRLLAEACFGSEEAAKLPHKYEPAKKDEPLLDLVKGGKKDGSSCTTASAKPLVLRDSTNVRAGKMNTSTGVNNSSPFGFSTEQAGATSSTSRAPFLLNQTRDAEEFRTLRRDIHKKENQLANPVKVLDPSTKLSALVVEDRSTTTAGSSSSSSRRSRSTSTTAAKENTLVKKYGQITDSCACVLAQALQDEIQVVNLARATDLKTYRMSSSNNTFAREGGAQGESFFGGHDLEHEVLYTAVCLPKSDATIAQDHKSGKPSADSDEELPDFVHAMPYVAAGATYFKINPRTGLIAEDCVPTHGVEIWQLESEDGSRPRLLRRLPSSGGMVRCLDWHESMLTAGREDGTVSVHDIRDRDSLMTIIPICKPLEGGKTKMETGFDKKLHPENDPITRFGGRKPAFTDHRDPEAFHRRDSTGRQPPVPHNAGLLAVGTESGKVCVLDMRNVIDVTKNPEVYSTQRLEGFTSPVTALTWGANENGTTLAAGDLNGRVKLLHPLGKSSWSFSDSAPDSGSCTATNASTRAEEVIGTGIGENKPITGLQFCNFQDGATRNGHLAVATLGGGTRIHDLEKAAVDAGTTARARRASSSTSSTGPRPSGTTTPASSSQENTTTRGSSSGNPRSSYPVSYTLGESTKEILDQKGDGSHDKSHDWDKRQVFGLQKIVGTDAADVSSPQPYLVALAHDGIDDPTQLRSYGNPYVADHIHESLGLYPTTPTRPRKRSRVTGSGARGSASRSAFTPSMRTNYSTLPRRGLRL
ncbi:unnamed protein product [Amoebophrya sp. A120]|nr:unnamed protein product [Amoebophrya sp. A120]|eukprot:GSA120T00014111001.1